MEHTNEILELPIEKLNLSLRTCFCLKKIGIHKVSDLIKHNISDLYKVRNLGSRCYDEIVNKVHDLGLCFNDEKEENKEKRI